MGDPAGIGPEVTLKALASPRVKGLADFFIIGDRAVIEKSAKICKIDPRGVEILDLANVDMSKFVHGACRQEFGAASIEYIDKALEFIAKGLASALVTAPINKLSISKAGFKGFEGHTEYLAAKTRTKDFAMIFVGGKLKISLVTRHVPLKDVPRRISSDRVYRNILLTHSHLKERFGIKNPRIGVAGLNPHAGEGGMFGNEERHIIAPAVRIAAKRFKGVKGPFPPDIIFNDLLGGKFDAVVAMYHDQALIPFKLLHFSDGVNLTAGLPFLRTSPDHGTAFDIAGKGIANAASMIEAIRLAVKLSKK